MTARRLLTLVAASAACMVGAIATPSTALAAAVGDINYSLPPCWNGIDPPARSGWQLDTSSCPDMTLTQVGPTTPDETTGPYIARTLPGIVGVRITMGGSNGTARGVQQGIRVCSPVRCGALIQPPSDDAPPTQYLLSQDTGEVPDRADHVELVARCLVAAGCPPGPGLTLTDFSIGLIDRTPPTADLFEVDANWQPIDARPGPWHNDTVRWSWNPSDAESGVLYGEFQGFPEEPAGSPCLSWVTPTPGWVCRDWEGDPGPRETSVAGFDQGMTTLEVRAVDFGGNATTSSLPIRVDTIPPMAPPQLAVAGAPHGWTRSTQIALQWADADGLEGPETDKASGVVSADVDVEPLDLGWGGQPQTQRIDVVGPRSVDVKLPSTGRWRATVRLVDRAGNVGAPSSVDVAVDPDGVVRPVVAAPAPVTASVQAAGMTVRWTQTSPTSGICGYAYAINGTATYDPGRTPAAINVSGAVDHVRIAPAELAQLDDGPAYVHLRAFSCAGAAGPLVHAPLTVDLTPPTMEPVASDGWSSDGSGVTLRAVDRSPSGLGSGVARIEVAVDGGAFTPQAGASVPLTLADGRHTVVAVAVDRTGNRSAPQTLDVHIDTQPPAVHIDPPPAADPLALRATADDPGAGTVDIALEYRAAGSTSAWLRLARTTSPAQADRQIVVSARIPDAGELRGGRYELRAVAVDALGHTAVASDWSAGGSAEFTSPVRPRPTLTLTATPGKAGAGDGTVTGRLTDPDGQPLAGAQVVLASTTQGGRPEQVGEVTTDAAGAYRVPLSPGGSRTLAAIYRGSATLGPARGSAELDVRAGATLQIAPRTIHAHGHAAFTGRVLSPGVALPLAGKLVVIDVRAGGRWRPFTKPFRTASDGSFRRGLTGMARRGAVRLTFRARVPLEPGWPLLDGVSRTASVVVAP